MERIALQKLINWKIDKRKKALNYFIMLDKWGKLSSRGTFFAKRYYKNNYIC